MDQSKSQSFSQLSSRRTSRMSDSTQTQLQLNNSLILKEQLQKSQIDPKKEVQQLFDKLKEERNRRKENAQVPQSNKLTVSQKLKTSEIFKQNNILKQQKIEQKSALACQKPNNKVQLADKILNLPTCASDQEYFANSSQKNRDLFELQLKQSRDAQYQILKKQLQLQIGKKEMNLKNFNLMQRKQVEKTQLAFEQAADRYSDALLQNKEDYYQEFIDQETNSKISNEFAK